MVIFSVLYAINGVVTGICRKRVSYRTAPKDFFSGLNLKQPICQIRGNVKVQHVDGDVEILANRDGELELTDIRLQNHKSTIV